ncbi:alpha/beta-hydrolase [Sodiomyces alkalinus F11]|uniref:Alpha/beta-hydrolase n=1 Tax=Sodiomyces alkalinus (strain CBS 110278 / VKM F-3762 / F11) TaxID=1314773 RepID=A0A3N2PL50_SODAK|nr:alpha/beta-hydrolase [Sodiomyces alkalinus F11]ROT35056.1 alpha/beta-hydrolase [Sodiomyces alkalinus F11]
MTALTRSPFWALATAFTVLQRTAAGPTNSPSASCSVKPLLVDLSAEVPRMMDLINNTRLPDLPVYPGVGSSMGIDLDVLKSLKDEWLNEFDWEEEQEEMNKLNHYTAVIEGLTVHFTHEESDDPAAIPLLINHGWPGSSFLEFGPVLDALTASAETEYGTNVSFHVVAPSLPGFAFSDPAPENWTLADTARIYNALMTNVLGYPTFAVHGTAHGAAVAYTLYEDHNTTTRAAHFSFIPFFPPTAEAVAAMGITLDPLEQFMLKRSDDWGRTGNAYYLLQLNTPNTIGLALYDSPVGQLAWIGEKYIDWSDPSAGVPPSLLTRREVLRCVSLYYLTHTFVSSIYTYAQNPMAFRHAYTKPPTTAPLLLSQFKYNVGFWPRQVVETVGNLVEYRNHELGGNFPALDNPDALIEDIRRIGDYWEQS